MNGISGVTIVDCGSRTVCHGPDVLFDALPMKKVNFVSSNSLNLPDTKLFLRVYIAGLTIKKLLIGARIHGFV